MSDTKLFWQVRALLRLCFSVGRWYVEGQEHVPADGPLILATNHLSIFDPPLVMASAPVGPITVMAKAEFRNPFNPAGWILRTVPVIYVKRGGLDRSALRQALAVLQRSGRLGLAPEGTRSPTGTLQEGRGGAAYMALRTRVPIVAVATWGQERIAGALRQGRRPEYWVRFGRPFRLEVDTSLTRSEQVNQGTEQIMRRLAALLPPEYRGVYAAAVAESEDEPALTG